ncbi:MAG: relaxase/mobilization nuclease domain-containing protein [Butyribacter sp.]|nr:relaxase/mobilization nuclease domain-containing protein [bacterium]MDY3854494.1 relaxase/mobilization nuclease domain-containing protein [Butyribacter sp.]
MAKIKKVNKSYTDIYAVANLLKYVLNPEKQESGICGCGGLFLNNDMINVARQIYDINFYYGKDQGTLVHHFIISYPYLEGQCTPQKMQFALHQVLNMDLCGFPYVYALHENTLHPHFHLIIGSVNIYTGMRYLDKNSTIMGIGQTLSANTVYFGTDGRKHHLQYDAVYDEKEQAVN